MGKGAGVTTLTFRSYRISNVGDALGEPSNLYLIKSEKKRK